MALEPQIAELPQIALEPSTHALDPQIAELPQIALDPQIAELPQIALVLFTTDTDPVAVSYRATGEAALEPLPITSLAFSAAQISR